MKCFIYRITETLTETSEVEEHIEQTYPIHCKGRNSKGEEVLTKPLEVNVRIDKSPGSNTISSTVDCKYNTGSHGERCKASHPKVGEGASCPYSFDTPYAFDNLENP